MANGHDATELVLEDFDTQVKAATEHIRKLKSAPYVDLRPKNGMCPDHSAMAENVVLVKEGQGISLSGQNLIIRAMKQVYIRGQEPRQEEGERPTSGTPDFDLSVTGWGKKLVLHARKNAALLVVGGLIILSVLGTRIWANHLLSQSDALAERGQHSATTRNAISKEQLSQIVQAVREIEKGKEEKGSGQ